MTKVVFMGTPHFAVPVLQQLIHDGYDVIAVVTQPDRPVGRKRVLTPPPVKVEAEHHNIPVIQPFKITEEYQAIVDLAPDLIVTAAFGQILPKVLLDAPKYGCINVHASLLPKLRGGAPIHYSVIEGHKTTGVTIMYMVEKLDAGDMLTKVEIPIEEEDHVGTMHDKLSVLGAKLLSETIPKLLVGELTPEKQVESEATFAPNITREKEKINWSKSGEEIYNHIRGMHPFPVAYTTWGETPMKVWWGVKVAGMSGTPGEIMAKEEDGFVVATGNDTAIKIMDLQVSGKKRMTGKQFLHGAGAMLHVGTKLGEKAWEK